MKNPVLSKGALKKTTVNPPAPFIKGPSGGGKGVSMAPKINAEAGGKRVVMTNASPNSKKNTFTAPRSSGGGSVTDLGYTKLGKA